MHLAGKSFCNLKHRVSPLEVTVQLRNGAISAIRLNKDINVYIIDGAPQVFCPFGHTLKISGYVSLSTYLPNYGVLAVQCQNIVKDPIKRLSHLRDQHFSRSEILPVQPFHACHDQMTHCAYIVPPFLSSPGPESQVFVIASKYVLHK